MRRGRLVTQTVILVAVLAAVVATAVVAGRARSRRAAPLPPPALVRPRSAGAAPSVAVVSRSCPRASQARPLPSDFPRSFPLPPGTVVTRVRRRPGSGRRRVLELEASVPATLRAGTVFFLRELSPRGFYLRGGEAETYDAEASFVGSRVTGVWKLVAHRGCPHVLTLLVAITPV
jgi:hypothetical protein